ncbi:hypothetical protein [Chitinophaga sp.]|uniref:hypothetical protein n=1 Tax=Chitinophaga sp. TaxID=1869181 RepID=UPI002F93D63E
MFKPLKVVNLLKYFILSGCLLLTHFCFAQANVFPGTGNVGIEAPSPKAKLQIGMSSLDTVSAISIGRAGEAGKTNIPLGGVAGAYNIDFYTWRDMTPDQIGARIRAERINRYNANSALIQGMDLVFHTSPGSLQSDLTERMRINNLGNVGIGTALPGARLHVAAPSGTLLARFSQIDTSGGDGRLTISNGIGAANNFIPVITGRAYTPGRPFGLYLEGDAEDVVPTVGDAGMAAVILDGRNRVAAPLVNNNVLAVNNYGQNLLMVKANGSVGIGTTDTKGYKLAVNGSGIFTQIKVKVYSAWPDYVFSDNYALPSLQSLEQFISVNKHLPEIPAEKEVLADGQDLGEMNRLLLKKVEELTLYIIQLNKKVDAQQEEISKLKQ